MPGWVVDEAADLLKFKIALIVVYAQWVNLEGETFDSTLFDKIQNAPIEGDWKPIVKESQDSDGMSKIMSMWLFKGDREFNFPYNKRTNTTNSTTLDKDGWADWFSGRVDNLVSVENNGLYLSSQLQVMGGKNSMLRNNAGNGTAYGWRDTTLGGTWDAFYDAKGEENAKAWQDENDKGALIHFSKQDRRLLWGSYGDWDMKKVWQHYYDEPTYRRLQQIRKQADPKGVFTANPFCVEAEQ